MKTKTVDLPIQNSLHWQLSIDMLNAFVENEVTFQFGFTALSVTDMAVYLSKHPFVLQNEFL